MTFEILKLETEVQNKGTLCACFYKALTFLKMEDIAKLSTQITEVHTEFVTAVIRNSIYEETSKLEWKVVAASAKFGCTRQLMEPLEEVQGD